MAVHSVVLTITYTPATVVLPSYQLAIVASGGVGISNNLFVYRKTTLGNNVLEGVATPSQLLTVPDTTPDPEALEPNKFKIASMQVASAQADVLAQQQTDIIAAVQALLTSLADADNFSTTQVVTLSDGSGG